MLILATLTLAFPLAFATLVIIYQQISIFFTQMHQLNMNVRPKEAPPSVA